ncbi:putative reverse transcriptase domain-containing protein [Tanacetum coccineum]
MDHRLQAGYKTGSTIFPLAKKSPQLFVHICDFSHHSITLVKVLYGDQRAFGPMVWRFYPPRQGLMFESCLGRIKGVSSRVVVMGRVPFAFLGLDPKLGCVARIRLSEGYANEQERVISDNFYYREDGTLMKNKSTEAKKVRSHSSSNEDDLGDSAMLYLKTSKACSKVFRGDIYGDHAVSCAAIIGIKHRHNVVRDTLVDICFRSGISAEKEVDIGLDGGRDKPLRPADMLLYLWDKGLDVCVDLTGSSPLTQTGMVDFVHGRAVIDAAHHKRVKYEAKCADIGYGFLPFSFSSFGELEIDAVTLLKRIRRFSVAQNIGAYAAIHIFSRINFAIAKGECNKKNSKSRYALFYGSDAEDTDEEDWPQPRDAETRERMLLARGPPTYRSNRKPVECTNLPTSPRSQPLPLPPPPSPSPPPTLDFQERVRLLDEHAKQLWNLRHLSTPGLHEVWKALLAVKSFVLPPTKDSETRVKIAPLCRTSGRISQAKSTLIKLLQALSPGLGDESIQEILSSFRHATHCATKWANAWHTWALFNTAVMSYYTLRGLPNFAS